VSDTPCGDVRAIVDATIGKGMGQVVGVAVQQASSQAIGKAVTGRKGAAAAAKVGNALQALQTIAKLQKLFLLLNALDIRAYAGNPESGEVIDRMERPGLVQNVKTDIPVPFVAIAGIDEDKWEEYKRELDSNLKQTIAEMSQALNDCANQLNLPSVASLADLVKELDGYFVEWQYRGPVTGSPRST
jgi:hypothetical protein